MVAAYEIPGSGSSIDAYVLKSSGNDEVAAWVLNNRYNHDYIKNTGVPPAATGASLKVPNVLNGNYIVRLLDCSTGAEISTSNVNVTNFELTIALPDFPWDMAVLASPATVGIPNTSTQSNNNQNITLSPNPVKAGRNVQIELTADHQTSVRITMLDQAGRSVASFGRFDLQNGNNSLPVTIPAETAAGIYRIMVEGGEGLNSKWLVVSN